MSQRKFSPQLDSLERSVDRWQNALMACTALVLAVVLVKCIVRIWPNPYWDWDPRSPQGHGAISGLGPSGLAWLNAASVLLAATAMGLHIKVGGRIAWRSTILVMIGAAVCALHMQNHAENMRIGGSWIASATLGLASLHLAEHKRPRSLIIAVLVALLLPLALDAMWYVWVEHPATIEDFLTHETQILAARGIGLNSPGHELFVQRMMVPDAIGAFALSNVFGSVLACLTLTAATMAIGALRAGWRRHAIAPVVVTLFGLVAVGLTRSKGAATMMGGVAALISLVLLIRRQGMLNRFLAPVSLALVAVVILVVLGRGALGPPSTQYGERSLLFRAHYWQSTVQMVQGHGMTGIVLGLGPDRFRDNYPQFKNRINPEQVTSAHNVFVDYVAVLGLGGIAWGGLLLSWLWTSACQATRAPGSSLHRNTGARIKSEYCGVNGKDLLWALTVAIPIFATQFIFEHQELDLLSRLIWLVGVGGFVTVTVALLGPVWYDAVATRFALFAAALLLMLHNQIDMTFHMVGGSAIAWLAIGAAAARQSPCQPRHSGKMQMILPIMLLLTSIMMATGLAIPVTRQQHHLAAAARHMRVMDLRRTLHQLEKAIDTLPKDPGPYRSLVRLLIAHQENDRAKEVLDKAERSGLNGVWRLKLLLAVGQQKLENTGPSLAPAWLYQTMKRLIRRRPFDLQSHLHVADLNWLLGNRTAAANDYRRCLELNKDTYLQPAWQLTTPQRKHITKRLGLLSQ